jgi:hypothetical protein
MLARFDPEYPLQYGYYSCAVCGREWYDDYPFHMPGCQAEAMYVFGPKQMIDFTPVDLRDHVSHMLSEEVKSRSI